MIITPFRYTIVEDGLFRGAYPTRKNLRFLKRLKLKTIISVIPGVPNEDLVEFCKQENINNIHYTVPKFSEDDAKVTILASTVGDILQMMIDKQNLPLFVHCVDGAHTTGTIIMCLRKLQNWSLSVIFNEFIRFTRDNSINSTESDFVETFKREIMVPVCIPKWLWEGDRHCNHPTIKVKLIPDNEEKKKDNTKKTVHAHWKDPSDVTKSSGNRNLEALGLINVLPVQPNPTNNNNNNISTT